MNTFIDACVLYHNDILLIEFLRTVKRPPKRLIHRVQKYGIESLSTRILEIIARKIINSEIQ